VLFCAAYLLPGLLGRDPWKNADITAFGYMLSLATENGSWFHPTLAGLPSDGALLPYWLGAVFIHLFSNWLEPALAARLPFALLLGWVMQLTWSSCFHWARTQAAQPLRFAFGGEADPIPYAQALADGALLALIASLGLLQLGHETTPELTQLLGASLFLYGLSTLSLPGLKRRLATLCSLPIMAASGAPSLALVLCIFGLANHLTSKKLTDTPLFFRASHFWLLAAGLLAFGISWLNHGWSYRLVGPQHLNNVLTLWRQWVWFLWPAWPLALWTLWRWKNHWLEDHIKIPLGYSLIMLLVSVAMNGSDRVLLLALPALAVLAAFALPTLKRGAAAAIDWFSVFFFSIFALFIWVMYLAMQTGVPAQPARNIARLAPGFEPSFSAPALVIALLGCMAWLWLVKWRVSRHRHPVWKSLVLPAGGVALCWLMLMTLWLPALNHARSDRQWVERMTAKVSNRYCVSTPNMDRAQLAGMIYFGHYDVDVTHTVNTTKCIILMLNETRDSKTPAPKGWSMIGQISRRANRNDVITIYKRNTVY
jgi:4-amino-4-deoxy-L-arabinose transferase-like glycosyltransferase